MKKIPFTLMISLSATITAFAEGTGAKPESLPVNNTIVMAAAVIMLIGIVGVSAFNGHSYKKENLRKMMSEYSSAQKNRFTGKKQSYSQNNYQKSKTSAGGNSYSRSTYYNPNNNGYDHNQMHQQQMNDEINRQMQQQINDEFNRQAMEHTMNEGWKSVTPFDHGGYVQGPGFNPSDTAAQQMNDMNNMNMGMF